MAADDPIILIGDKVAAGGPFPPDTEQQRGDRTAVESYPETTAPAADLGARLEVPVRRRGAANITVTLPLLVSLLSSPTSPATPGARSRRWRATDESAAEAGAKEPVLPVTRTPHIVRRLPSLNRQAQSQPRRKSKARPP